MGKGDNKPRPTARPTRELTAVQLAALAKETKRPIHDEPALDLGEGSLAVGRTTTLNDPLTTSLLAEVARESQTQEFDEDLLKELRASLENKPDTERKSG